MRLSCLIAVVKTKRSAVPWRDFIRGVAAGFAASAVSWPVIAAEPATRPADETAARSPANLPILLAYKTQLDVLWQGHDGKLEWFGPRVGAISPNTAVLLMHRSTLSGSDVVLGMYDARSDDGGRSWSAPRACEGLQRRPFEKGIEICPMDMVPGWHLKSRRLLALGHTACYVPDAKTPVFADSPILASYSVYDARNPYDIARTTKRGANNRVYLCRVQWERPNRIASQE